jgi:hypothetical protein
MSAPDLFAFAVSAAIGRHRAPAKTKRGKRVEFTVYEGEDVRTIKPAGRDAWALGELITAADEGCTPIDHPGPRWSGYVHKLKCIYGLSIETITEMHGGEFAGKHARYVLRSRVAFANPEDAARHGGDQ